MAKENILINKYASIIYRIGQIYFDDVLEEYNIGCGQQFFLLRISQNPGIGIIELAEKGYFDKGTTARAVKKLEDNGYIKRFADKQDKRIYRLYTTDEAIPVLDAINTSINRWHDILTTGLSEEEISITNNSMGKMSENAYFRLQERKNK